MIRAIMLLAFAGCAPAPYRIEPSHPAHPSAPTGRLAGPPAALRPGVIDVAKPADHSHH